MSLFKSKYTGNQIESKLDFNQSTVISSLEPTETNLQSILSLNPDNSICIWINNSLDKTYLVHKKSNTEYYLIELLRAT